MIQCRYNLLKNTHTPLWKQVIWILPALQTHWSSVGMQQMQLHLNLNPAVGVLWAGCDFNIPHECFSTTEGVFFLSAWVILGIGPKWWHGNIASISCQKQCFWPTYWSYWCQCRVIGMLEKMFQSSYWIIGRGCWGFSSLPKGRQYFCLSSNINKALCNFKQNQEWSKGSRNF